MSTTDGTLWLAAAIAARFLNVPFYLILHDDWEAIYPLPGWARKLQSKLFGRFYRRAAGRLCISEPMAADYLASYGAPAEVLLPSRGDDSPKPLVRMRAAHQDFVVAYAGSLFADYKDTLGRLADALMTVGGRLDIYTTHPLGVLAKRPNVRFAGFFNAAELTDRVASTADLLFVPVAFAADWRRNAIIAFPSKLADYTAMGLPILICGPDYSTPVQWAAQYPGVAEVLTSNTPAAIENVIQKLVKNRGTRAILAQRAIEIGEHLFTLDHARRTFFGTLLANGTHKL